MPLALTQREGGYRDQTAHGVRRETMQGTLLGRERSQLGRRGVEEDQRAHPLILPRHIVGVGGGIARHDLELKIRRCVRAALVDCNGKPGAFGTWGWVDRSTDTWGLLFMFDFRGFMATVGTTTTVLSLFDQELANHPAPPPPVPRELADKGATGWIDLRWEGGMLESSQDLHTWTPHPTAVSPFYFSVHRPPDPPRRFFRVQLPVPGHPSIFLP